MYNYTICDLKINHISIILMGLFKFLTCILKCKVYSFSLFPIR